MRLKNILSAIVCLAMVVIAVCACLGNVSVMSEPAPIAEASTVSPLATHAPIRINSDSDATWSSFPGRVINNLDINGTSAGFCIYIGNCTQAFTIKNCSLTGAQFKSHPYFRGASIEFYKCQNGTAINNDISLSDLGVYLFTSHANQVQDNLIGPVNTTGIYLEYSNRNTISGNDIGTVYTGIGIYSSEENGISGNYIHSCTNGMLVEAANRNSLSLNMFTGNDFGVYLQGYMGSCNQNTIYGNNCTDNPYGVRMDWDCNGNTISNNEISLSNQAGIYIEESDLNKIEHNALFKNNISVSLYACDYHDVAYNNISTSTGPGIALYDSDYNRLHHNNLVGNNGTGKQASDILGSNFWNDTAEGNYWSDWTSPDTSPKDGIVDSPYIIPGGTGKDNFPLTEPVLDAGVAVPFAGVNVILIILALTLMMLALAILKRTHDHL